MLWSEGSTSHRRRLSSKVHVYSPWFANADPEQQAPSTTPAWIGHQHSCSLDRLWRLGRCSIHWSCNIRRTCKHFTLKVIQNSSPCFRLTDKQDKLDCITEVNKPSNKTYICLYSLGVARDTSGYFFSRCSAILSESWIHSSPSRSTGIRPLGFFSINLWIHQTTS